MIGIALNFAISIGISTTVGSMVPLFFNHSTLIMTPKGYSTMAGVAIMLIGIVISAVAGKAKDRELGIKQLGAEKSNFALGLLLAIVSGVLCPLQNFGLVYGQIFLTRAAAHGVAPARQADVIWPPLLTATLIPYLLYCVYLWRKNSSFSLYRKTGRWWYWIAAVIMGSLWMGSVALYGTASAKLGTLGPIFAWPLFMSVIIVCSNAWGFATGEWKSVSHTPSRIMLAGILFLVFGFFAIAYSARLS
jgi:L-rhamnose-H+ transport protein